MGHVFAVWNKKGGKVFGFSQPCLRDGDSYDTKTYLCSPAISFRNMRSGWAGQSKIPRSAMEALTRYDGPVGLYQVNMTVPAGIQLGGYVPVSLSIGSATSNSVSIAVQ